MAFLRPGGAMLIHKRKDDHINISLKQAEHIDKQGCSISSLRLNHRAFPELVWNEIDPSVTFLGKKLSFPLLIGSMSGGSKRASRLNRVLAEACRETGAGLALGSCRILLKENPEYQGFHLRKLLPDGLILLNLGVNQLRPELKISQLEEMVKQTGADGLILHVNPAQELLQPEGDRDFKGLISRLKDLCDHINIPLGLKETGMGFGLSDMEALKGTSLSFLDAAGNDGANWAMVEGFRSRKWGRKEAANFKDWGYSTLESLEHCLKHTPSCPVIASGGIRSGADMVKSMALGATIASMALPLLKPALHSSTRLIETLNSLERNFRRTMLLSGVKDTNSLIGNRDLLWKRGVL